MLNRGHPIPNAWLPFLPFGPYLPILESSWEVSLGLYCGTCGRDSLSNEGFEKGQRCKSNLDSGTVAST